MRAQKYLGAVMLVVVLFMSFPASAWACQNKSTGDRSKGYVDTVDVEAYVYAYSNGTVWYDAGVASVSNPPGACTVKGMYVTALGYNHSFTVNAGGFPDTYSFPVNEVGPSLTTEALSNDCDPSNIPAVTAFRNGACAMVLNGVSVIYDCTSQAAPPARLLLRAFS